MVCSWARHLTPRVPLPPPPPPSPPLPPRCINIGAMDLSIPSRREYKYFQSLPATETGDKRRPDGPLGLQTLPLHLLALYGSLSHLFFPFYQERKRGHSRKLSLPQKSRHLLLPHYSCQSQYQVRTLGNKMMKTKSSEDRL